MSWTAWSWQLELTRVGLVSFRLVTAVHQVQCELPGTLLQVFWLLQQWLAPQLLLVRLQSLVLIVCIGRLGKLGKLESRPFDWERVRATQLPPRMATADANACRRKGGVAKPVWMHFVRKAYGLHTGHECNELWKGQLGVLPYSPVTVICAGHVDRRHEDSGSKPRLPTSCLIETPNAELTMARQEKTCTTNWILSAEMLIRHDKAFKVPRYWFLHIDFCMLISAR